MVLYKSPIISKAKPIKAQVAGASNRIGNSSKPAARPQIHLTLDRSKDRGRRVWGDVPSSVLNAPGSAHFARTHFDYADDDHDHEMRDGNASSGDEDDDDMADDWEEGRTLVDNLKNFGVDNSDDALEELLACADELQGEPFFTMWLFLGVGDHPGRCDSPGPMSAKSKELQQDLIDTLVPAMDHIRIVHGLLENTVEKKYTEAVLEFDKAADGYHTEAAQCRAELVKMVEDSRKVIGKQFTILQNEYAKRSKLYDDFLAKVQEIGKLIEFFSLSTHPLTFSAPRRAGAATLQGLDEDAKEDIEQLQSELEKKSKVFAKMGNAGKSQNLLLKSLMGGRK
ncbi:hypothetical protein FRB90_000466 [Tulasnella sp. 427]|nr:hypothetical protein FRB90_000466 [Tulasnella sp. 427]